MPAPRSSFEILHAARLCNRGRRLANRRGHAIGKWGRSAFTGASYAGCGYCSARLVVDPRQPQGEWLSGDALTTDCPHPRLPAPGKEPTDAA
jgi:hypothetical protein